MADCVVNGGFLLKKVIFYVIYQTNKGSYARGL